MILSLVIVVVISSLNFNFFDHRCRVSVAVIGKKARCQKPRLFAENLCRTAVVDFVEAAYIKKVASIGNRSLFFSRAAFRKTRGEGRVEVEMIAAASGSVGTARA